MWSRICLYLLAIGCLLWMMLMVFRYSRSLINKNPN